MMKAQHVTECELLVMKSIWSKEDDMALPAIVSLVNETYGKTWAPQTVSTFLKRLVTRGFLRMYRQGRSFYYHEIISEKEYSQLVIVDSVDFWWGGDAAEMLKAFNEQRKLTKEEKAAIKKLL